MSLEALQDCLPERLRGPATVISRVAAGLSGAGVYRVEAAGESFVLKLSGEAEPVGDWRRKLHIQGLAAEAGLSPAIVHTDEARRAVVTVFVVDLSFPALFMNPSTRAAALAQLGATVRRLHQLPLPPGAEPKRPREFLAGIWSGLPSSFAVPAFVSAAVERVLAEVAPAPERGLVLSHNDLNPSNLVHDGERLLLLDWEVAGPNDPFYDLAAVAVFLRLDEASCRALLAAYDAAPVAALPTGFDYNRRLVAVVCGAIFLDIARRGGHAGAGGAETLESTLSLGDFYQKMRAGLLSPASPEGQWCFGLALIKAGAGEA
jgi:aminoglycoside phosphotransferase (APT) family kinase protein